MKKLQLIILSMVIALSAIACNETKKKAEDTAKSPPAPTQPENPNPGADPKAEQPPKPGFGEVPPSGGESPPPSEDAPPAPDAPPPVSSASTLVSFCTMAEQIWTYELISKGKKQYLELTFGFNQEANSDTTDSLTRLFKDPTKNPRLKLAPNGKHEGYLGQWKIDKVIVDEDGKDDENFFSSYLGDLAQADQSQEKLAYDPNKFKFQFTRESTFIVVLPMRLEADANKAFNYCMLPGSFSVDTDKQTLTMTPGPGKPQVSETDPKLPKLDEKPEESSSPGNWMDLFKKK